MSEAVDNSADQIDKEALKRKYREVRDKPIDRRDKLTPHRSFVAIIGGKKKSTTRALTLTAAAVAANGRSPRVINGASNAVPIDVVANTSRITSAAPLASLSPEAIKAW